MSLTAGGSHHALDVRGAELTIDVHIPTRETPSWTVAWVGGVAFLVGLGLAAWGMDDSERARVADGESYVPRADEPDPEPESDPGAPDPRAETETGSAPDAPTATATPATEPPSVPATPSAATPTADESPAEESGPRRVLPGRVAYLRCGPATGPDCPRDAPLEEAIWTALADLPLCARAPTRRGRADITIEYNGTDVPVVRWRDRFSSGTVRLDRNRVMGCLRPSLIATEPSIAPEQRLLLSFRFQLQ